MQVLSDELKDTNNVRINSFNLGWKRTDIRALAYPDESIGVNGKQFNQRNWFKYFV